MNMFSRRLRNLILLLGPVLFLAGVLYLQGQTVSPASAADWGLSFQTEGAPPVGNAMSEELAQYNACYVGDTSKKVIYLTFDCGYENGFTEPILDALKKHNAPAAFFVVGNMIESAPDIIRRMAEEGHIVGNHTFHHPDMSAISDPAAFRQELEELSALYRETVGADMPMYYRPPQGKYSEENLKQAHELGYQTVFWSLAYVDWYVDDQPTAEEAYAKLLPRIHDGAIVLLHSTSRTNAEILDDLLTKWEEMGYSFASLEELSAPKHAPESASDPQEA
ncbi:MAG: polysaccharide deacetylase family protein [Oscillospiraceae bacterium]|nr:polysaccharide deacetylase family protein [Oscillospiraceae bacterium]